MSKNIEIVNLTGYKCLSGHTHKTVDAAEKCNSLANKESESERLQNSKNRRQEIFSLKKSGVSTKEIASMYKISISRVNQIVKTEERRQGTPDPFEGLSVRLVNCLKAESIYSIDDVRNMREADLRKIPNLGKKSIDYLMKYIKGK